MDLQKETVVRLRNAVKNKQIDESIVDERVTRILKAKSELSIDLNALFSSVSHLIHSKEAQTLSSKIARGAVSLVKGAVYQPKPHTLFVGPMPKETSIADEKTSQVDTFERIQRETILDAYAVPINPDQEAIHHVLKLASSYEAFVVATYNGNV